MLDYLRHKFVRLTSWVLLIALLLHMVIFQFHDVQIEYFTVLVMTTVIITLFVTYKYPEKQWAFTLLPSILLVIFIALTPIYIRKYDQMLPLAYFIYPIISFFLQGLTLGLFTSLLLFFSIFIFIAMNNFDYSLIGVVGENYMIFLMLEIVLLGGLEWAHGYMFERIYTKTYHDDLTDLKNSSGILLDIETAVSNEKSFHLVLTDFDYFSLINSNLSQELCNNIIIDAAKIISDHEHVLSSARWKDDQFCLIFDGSKEELVNFLRLAHNQIRRLSDKYNIEIDITFSCGITTYPSENVTKDNLISYTEIALKEAQKGDRMVFHTFQPSNLEELNRNKTISQNTIAAIENRSITVHYQPKIDIKTGKVTGMEALVRWLHPELGTITPNELIPIAEKSGAIVPLAEYIIEQSLQHLKQCHNQGTTDLTVSINLSPLNLLRTGFITRFHEIVQQNEITPSDIYLEINEKVIMHSNMINLLTQLHQLGYKISLDNFGIGNASLTYLLSFPFDELKIDKSLTALLMEGEREIELFKSVVDITEHFNMRCVVEGLEMESQIELIRETNVHEIQGRYYSEALSSSDFLTYLIEENPVPENDYSGKPVF